jgi:hypothetical protein
VAPVIPSFPALSDGLARLQGKWLVRRANDIVLAIYAEDRTIAEGESAVDGSRPRGKTQAGPTGLFR